MGTVLGLVSYLASVTEQPYMIIIVWRCFFTVRNNQVNLTITRFGLAVPKDFPEKEMTVNIYADSDNLYAALSEAYANAVQVMKKWEVVADSCDVTTNVDKRLKTDN